MQHSDYKYSSICQDLKHFSHLCDYMNLNKNKNKYFNNNMNYDNNTNMKFDNSLCETYITLYLNCKDFRDRKMKK